MLLICTEYNSLRHAINLLEILSDLLSYFTMAILYNDVIIVVRVVVYSIGNLVPVNICLTFGWTPFVPDICGYIHHFEGS